MSNSESTPDDSEVQCCYWKFYQTPIKCSWAMNFAGLQAPSSRLTSASRRTKPGEPPFQIKSRVLSADRNSASRGGESTDYDWRYGSGRMHHVFSSSLDDSRRKVASLVTYASVPLRQTPPIKWLADQHPARTLGEAVLLVVSKCRSVRTSRDIQP